MNKHIILALLLLGLLSCKLRQESSYLYGNDSFGRLATFVSEGGLNADGSFNSICYPDPTNISGERRGQCHEIKNLTENSHVRIQERICSHRSTFDKMAYKAKVTCLRTNRIGGCRSLTRDGGFWSLPTAKERSLKRVERTRWFYAPLYSAKAAKAACSENEEFVRSTENKTQQINNPNCTYFLTRVKRGRTGALGVGEFSGNISFDPKCIYLERLDYTGDSSLSTITAASDFSPYDWLGKKRLVIEISSGKNGARKSGNSTFFINGLDGPQEQVLRYSGGDISNTTFPTTSSNRLKTDFAFKFGPENSGTARIALNGGVEGKFDINVNQTDTKGVRQWWGVSVSSNRAASKQEHLACREQLQRIPDVQCPEISPDYGLICSDTNQTIKKQESCKLPDGQELLYYLSGPHSKEQLCPLGCEKTH